MKDLIEAFNSMKVMPIIEIFYDNKWNYFTVHLDEKDNTFWTNTDDLESVIMKLDNDFSLDENLNAFYEKIIEHLLKNNHIIGEPNVL